MSTYPRIDPDALRPVRRRSRVRTPLAWALLIAIALVFVATLIPLGSYTPRQAHRFAALSNAKELAFGTMMYENDNDDFLLVRPPG